MQYAMRIIETNLSYNIMTLNLKPLNVGKYIGDVNYRYSAVF